MDPVPLVRGVGGGRFVLAATHHPVVALAILLLLAGVVVWQSRQR